MLQISELVPYICSHNMYQLFPHYSDGENMVFRCWMYDCNTDGKELKTEVSCHVFSECTI